MFMRSAKREKLLDWMIEFIGISCGCLILWLGGRKIIMNTADPAGFIAFIVAIFMLSRPLSRLGKINSINQKALAAAERIFEILDKKPKVLQKEEAADLPAFGDSIKFNNVSFAYGDETVLHTINLEVRKGDVLAIVGPSGGGKSSLVNLIPRFYDASAGNVTIDGRDVKDFKLKSLIAQIGIVTQETILFNDTVRANITYGFREASQAQVEDAAQRAFAHRFIINMPKGYETVIGDRGFRLSGGEKQRLSIARAVLTNPPILILDEATSQLDSESERYVQEALDELMRGRTVVAIAHRLSTIKKAHKIVVLEQGRIVGMGRHEELLTTCPLYEKLHTMQFQI